MKAVFYEVKKYHIEAVCETPMHVGTTDTEKTESEILIHPVTAMPFIQGSSISGVFGEYIKNYFDTDIMGFNPCDKEVDGRSSVVFSDALFQSNKTKIETRPHIKIDSGFSTVHSENRSGQVFNIVYISEKSEFSFDIYYFSGDKNDESEIIEQAISALDSGEIKIGGKTTTGCGKVGLKKVTKTCYDMRDANDRKLWINESKEEQEITNDIKKSDAKSDRYLIKVEAKADKLMVKGSFIDSMMLHSMGYSDEKYPDSMPASNPNSCFIVPGSSYKGVFRSRITSIAKYMGISDDFVENAFENRSRVCFYDTVIDKKDCKINTVVRNKIDKFTGGTISKSLFKETEISGKFHINFSVNSKERINSDNDVIWNDTEAKKLVGLMFLTIRDMAIHAATLGSGASVGRGFVDVSEVSVKKPDGTEYSIDFEKKDMNNESKSFINECIALLRKGD
ncbi:MAG: hypothetical protein J6A58_04950 [Oscillospiraceae bacterium]|nr:hypothetical protein [Oscillospiraceae bacterium]